MLLRRDFLIVLVIVLLLLALVAAGQAVPFPLRALRVLLGLAFILFIPGYALQAAVFPGHRDLDTPERLALSFGLSLAVVTLVALFLDRLPWGIRLWPIMLAEGALALLISLVAVLRRSRLPETQHAQPGSATGVRHWWASLERRERLLVAIMAGTLLTGSLAAAAILYVPSPADFYTEFYILNPEGLAEAYPRQTEMEEDLSVNVGITNRERQAQTYQVAVQVENPWRPGEFQVVGVAGPYTLQPDATVENPVHWQMPWSGQDQMVEFLLLMDGSPKPYRSLRLWLDVKP